MRLAIALNLRYFIYRLPTHPTPGIVRVQRLTAKTTIIEHQAIGQVAVVRNRQDLAPGYILVSAHPVPECFRICRVEGGKRQNAVGPLLAIAVDNVPVQVAAPWCACPFVGDQCGEGPGRVVLFCRRCHALPHCRFCRLTQRYRVYAFSHLFIIEDHRFEQIPCAKIAVQLFSKTAGKQLGIGLDHHRSEPEILRVVRNHQKIQGMFQTYAQPCGRGHGLAAGKPVCLLRAEAVPQQCGIGGIRGMHMRIAPQQLERLQRVCVWREDICAGGLGLVAGCTQQWCEDL